MIINKQVNGGLPVNLTKDKTNNGYFENTGKHVLPNTYVS